MTAASNASDVREIGRRWFEEVWNQRRDESIDELMADESIGHVEGGEVRGREGFRQMRSVFLNALPDVRMEIEDILAEGNRAAVRWRVVGTHTGEGLGVSPTNRTIDMRGTSWLVVRDGKLIEGWDTWNLGGLLSSLTSSGSEEQKLF